MLKLLLEAHFKKDVKKYKNNAKVKKLIDELILRLLNNIKLEEKYKNHQLKGKYQGYYDCHILPDLVLIYTRTEIELKLVRIGSHSELFK